MVLTSQTLLNESLLEKYSTNIPRYTSYPTAPEWNEEFKIKDYLEACEKANLNKTPVSLYFHLPFCESHCYFCACNVVISKKKEIVSVYLDHLKKEIDYLSQLTSKERIVEQIHLGGGTPTYFSPDELSKLYHFIEERFNISKYCEISVEVDPRVTEYEHLKVLSDLGFNRLSMGIQDFDTTVQEAVNRIQPYDQTYKLFSLARELGFNSINVDLIYGLPNQSLEKFAKTIDLIIKLNPDRIALFNFAYLPELFPHQAKYLLDHSLPDQKEKIKIFKHAVNSLIENGFIFIGLDHFAKPDDELEIARKNKTLHRNFQGYTTKSLCDLYGLGITAISHIQNTYSQNIKKLNPYYEKLDLNEIPIFRGIVLNKDDLLRKEIIMKILCHGEVIKSEIEDKYDIDFNQYFSYELEKLKEFENDGLLRLQVTGHRSQVIQVTPLGQFFLRNIACVFDYYLNKKNGKQRIFSKAI